MTEACKTLDRFIHARIASKRVELLSKCNENEMGEAHVDLLTALMGQEQAHDDRFLRDDEDYKHRREERGHKRQDIVSDDYPHRRHHGDRR